MSTGLAAGVGAVAAAALAIASWELGNLVPAAAALATVGALLGFLPYDFPPAKIFLGDSGTLGVGFLFGTVSLPSDLDRRSPRSAWTQHWMCAPSRSTPCSTWSGVN